MNKFNDLNYNLCHLATIANLFNSDATNSTIRVSRVTDTSSNKYGPRRNIQSSIYIDGPLLPFITSSHAALQLPDSGHWLTGDLVVHTVVLRL